MAGQGNRNRRPLNETNNDVGNFFTWLMNSSKTGVGTPQARDLGSSRYQGPVGNPDGSGQDPAPQKPGIGPFQGHGTIDVPRPSQPTGEPDMSSDTSRTNANGVTQTGKQMSSSAAFVPEYANRNFNDLLRTVNKGQFSSNQLPGTGDNPFSATPPKTQSFNTEAESYTDNSLSDFGGDGSAAFASSRETTENDTFNPSAPSIEGASNREEMAKLARRRAFLDADDSLAGLRAVEKQNGVVYAGGKHYVAGKNADSAAIGITNSDARDISSGKAKAQDFLAKKTAETVAATAQSPTVLEEGAANGAFQQDKPMFPGTTRAIGGAVEFDNNNSQTLPTFGAPKGFKPQSTYKDPAFPNPFG